MTTSKQNTARIKLKGDCTVYEIVDVQKKISRLLQKAPKVFLGLSVVERADASFLQLLISAQVEASLSKTQLIMSQPSESVSVLIETLHFHPSKDAVANSLDVGE